MTTRLQPRESLMQRIRRLEPAPPWGGFQVVFAVFICGVIPAIVGTIVAQVWFAEQSYALLAGWLIGGVLGLIVFQQRLRQSDERAALRLSAGGTPLPFTMFIAFGCALLFDLVASAFSRQFYPAPELIGVNLQTGGAIAWLLAFLFLLIVQPLWEEVIFRGVAFPYLRAQLGAWPGLLASALLSALFHLLIYPPNYLNAPALIAIVYGFLLPFLAGLVISAVRAHSGSTRSAIVAHAAFGLFALLKVLVVAG